MAQSLQVVNFFKQNITGGAFEALTPATGDTATFQNVPQNSPAYLAQVWGVDDTSAYELSLVASRFHDQQFGIRLQGTLGNAVNSVIPSDLLLPDGVDQKIFPSDVLTVNVNGTAGDNVNATFLIYYQDLPGISARLASAEYVRQNNKNLVGIHVSLTAGAGDYGATAALNAADNRLHANTDYAVLGFTSDTPCASVYMQGVDTGNQRVGGPVLANAEHDCSLFLDLAKSMNAPLIPVINSNNAGAINLGAANSAGGAVELDVILQELPQPFMG